MTSHLQTRSPPFAELDIARKDSDEEHGRVRVSTVLSHQSFQTGTKEEKIEPEGGGGGGDVKGKGRKRERKTLGLGGFDGYSNLSTKIPGEQKGKEKRCEKGERERGKKAPVETHLATGDWSPYRTTVCSRTT